MPDGALVYVFGHGQFIQAVQSIVVDSHLDARAKMQAFWRKDAPPLISNAERIEFLWEGCRWERAA
jgi:hypothetical protein